MYNAVNAREQVTFGLDSITIQKFIAGIKGGRILDVTGFPLDVILAGHVIITKDGVYKPMPLKQSGENLPTAAVSAQTAGSAISGTVYEGVTATTENAVKCALADKTIVYLAASAATGNAAEGKTYYTKDTDNKTFIGTVDADGNPVYEYDSLPSNYAYAGILYRSVLAKKPAASIMTNGQVNSECVPYPMTSILSAFKAACPLIEFIKDEEAQ